MLSCAARMRFCRPRQLFSAAELRPAGTAIVSGYIDEYKDRFGVEGICRVLGDQFACGFITGLGLLGGETPPALRPGRCRIGNCYRSSKTCTPTNFGVH